MQSFWFLKRSSVCAGIAFSAFLMNVARAAPTASALSGTTATCATNLTSLTTGSDAPQFLAITPSTFYEGSALTIGLSGSKLDPTWKILLCPNGTTKPASPPTISMQSGAISTKMSADVAAETGSSADYAVYVSDASGKVYDTGKVITILPGDDARYIPCAATQGGGKADPNLACSIVPLSYQVAQQVFGKGVANRFIAVAVIVRNKNHDMEYLLQDVRIGMPGLKMSSYDKKIPRGVGEKAEQFSARAIIFRLTAAGASVVTGIAGFAGNELLTDAAGVFAGPFQTGLQGAIPDLTAAELGRIDDLGFAVSSTVIPKNGAIPVVAFIPADTLDPAPGHEGRPLSWFRPERASYSTYRGEQLKELFSSISAQVAGTHFQEIDTEQPGLKTFVTSTQGMMATSVSSSGATLIIEGTALNMVSQVQLQSGNTMIPATIQPLSGESSIDPNVAQLVIPKASTGTYPSGAYTITFNTAAGAAAKTNQLLTLN